MLLGPVFTAEMVTTARKRRYFLLRLLFAAGLLFLLWMCAMGVRNGQDVAGRMTLAESAQLAQAYFTTISWATLVAALVVVPAIAAGSIATERDRRTIEYLFATDLSNAEIVLSKLFAKLLLVGKLLIVALPVLAIFRLLGGIPGDLLLAFYLVLGSTCLVLVMLSLSVSVWTSRARDAFTKVYLLLVALLLLPTLASGLLGWFTCKTQILEMIRSSIVTVCDAINSVNPLWVYFQATGAGGGALGLSLDFDAIWRLVISHVVISALLATVAVLAVRRVHLGSLGKSASKEKKPLLESMRFRPPLGSQPMVWKECFARTAGTKLGWIGRIAILLIVAVTLGIGITAFVNAISAGSSRWQQTWEIYMVCTVGTTFLYGSGVVLLVGVRAAGLISYEKERDCWLSLLATPLSGSEIVGAKMLGNLYSFRWLPLPMFVVWGLQTLLYPPYVIAIGFNLAVLTIASLFASTLGIAFSLKFNSSLKAIGATLGVLVMVGGGYMLCCCVPLVIGSGDDDILELAASMCIPFLFAIPSVVCVEGLDQEWMAVDYVVGMVGYGVLTGSIYAWAVNNFDQVVGRTVVRHTATVP